MPPQGGHPDERYKTMKKTTKKTRKPAIRAFVILCYCDRIVSETQYATREEADAALAAIRTRREKEDAEYQAFRAANGGDLSNYAALNEDARHTAFVNGWTSNISPMDEFRKAGYRVDEVDASSSVYRLNSLPGQDEETMHEIEWKMAAFGEVSINWTCMGWTRAEWQSEAAAEQVNAAHPEWVAEAHTEGFGYVTIRRR